MCSFLGDGQHPGMATENSSALICDGKFEHTIQNNEEYNEDYLLHEHIFFNMGGSKRTRFFRHLLWKPHPLRPSASLALQTLLYLYANKSNVFFPPGQFWSY